jgi:membrane fusion protein, multidrug efflux system
MGSAFEIGNTPSGRRRAAAWVAIVAGALGLSGAACRRDAPPPVPPQVVRVAVAHETDSTRELRLSGTIEAERSSSLSFAVPGTVEAVLVQEGETVRRGQALARLNARSSQDALGIAKAKASQAEDAYRRLEPMHRNRTIPEVRWIEVETGVQQARSSLSMAQKNLDDTVLRAPEPGIVARRNVEPGVTAVPGSPAIILVQTHIVLATAPVPETQVSGVKKGQTARIVVAALGATLEGTVREVGVVANPLTRTYAAKIAVANPEGALRVGMVAEVFLRQENPSRAVVVPPEAVRVDETGRSCVYVVGEGERLRRQEVEVSGFLGEGTALARGVAAGERVVISGSPMLTDGMAVRVEPAAPPQTPANPPTARQ